jgi:hypothetical protein
MFAHQNARITRLFAKFCQALDLRHLTRESQKVRYFLAVSQTSASASPENNRQPEQDDCDRHKRRAGHVSKQDEEDRDDGEDCCDVVVHSFPIVGFPTLPREVTWSKVSRFLHRASEELTR